MRIKVFVFTTLIVLFLPLLCSAKTLVVTHPMRRYYTHNAVINNVLSLLRDPSFDRKLVLIDPEESLAFAKKSLKFENVISIKGEIKWDGRDRDLVVAGAIWGQCLQRTLADLIIGSRMSGPLHILVKMDAVVSFFGLNQSSKTLNDLEVYFGKEKFNRFITVDVHKIMTEAAATCTELLSADSLLKLRLSIHGQSIKTIGAGPYVVFLNFD
jgi:hypothetical protein